jgi:hypothetical protein
MTDCNHPKVITYHDADTGKPVPLWACADCGHRFAPLVDNKSQVLYLIDAWERGCDHADYWLEIAALRERLK